MENLAQDLQEFLHSICDVEGDEAIELDEIAVRATAKFGARMKANKRVGKKLTPSKYLKKYGNRWHNLKDEVELDGEEVSEGKSMWKPPKEFTKSGVSRGGVGSVATGLKKLAPLGHDGRTFIKNHPLRKEVPKVSEEIDNAPKEKDPKAQKLSAGEIAYQYIKKSKGKAEASKIRRVGIDGTLHEGKQPTAKGAAKWERKTKYRVARDKTRNLEGKKEERESKTGIPHSSGHGISESVKPAKGTKKDKRPDTLAPELPTMPAGMNAGMRMMAASFDDFKGELMTELSKDTVLSAYKERLSQAKAHDVVGDTEGAKKHAEKALKHAEYHKGHEASREKYAKYKEARATIAKRAKTPDPQAEKRLALQKRREARRTLYGDRKKNENAQ